MKKRMPILLMSSVLLLGMGTTILTSCGGDSGGQVTPDDEPNIKEVTLSGNDETKYLGGSTIALKAKVTPLDSSKEFSSKVTWSSSDTSVATVTNGAVKFINNAEDKKVTITATSKEDETKKASIEFDVIHSPIDLVNSRGNGLDTSMYFDDGTVTVEPGDVAIISSEAMGKKFYYEATITLTSFAESENYAKFGIMVGDNPEGYWAGQGENIRSGFFYVDAMRSQMGTGWNNFNFVHSSSDLMGWDFGNQIGQFSTGSEKVELDKEFKMGLLRDGTNYTLYLSTTEDKVVARKSFEWDMIGEDEDAYVWLGGFNTGAVVKNFVGYSGDASDVMYQIPTTMELAQTEETVYLGGTCQITPKFDKTPIDHKKVTYAVEDPSIATVSQKGLVTALDKAGTTKITVKYENGETVLTSNFTFTVTDDEFFKVVLDGKMDDLIYTEAVKTNKFRFYKNDKVYIDFYASKNSRGVYLFADYYTDVIKEAGSNWWEKDNFEFRLGTAENLDLTEQIWAGTAGSNLKEFAKVPLVEKDGKFNGQFELFIPYTRIAKDNIQATAADNISFKVGSNPNAGWYQCSWFNSNNPGDYAFITQNGFAHGYPNFTTCSEGHEGEWVVDVEPTCQAEGSRHKTCRWCGHVETETLPADPSKHNYDFANAKVVTPSTCTKHGEGSAVCTICGAEQTTQLPLDPTNHSGHDFSKGACPDCHSFIEKPVLNDKKASAGGWNNREEWTELFDNLTGDFNTEINYVFEGNKGSSNENHAWETPLFVVTNAVVPEGKTYGDNATFRLDWFGWMDDIDGDGQKIADEQNCGTMYVGNFDNEMPSVLRGPTNVTVNVKRVGSTITLDYKIAPQNSEQVYEYHQFLKGVKPESIDLSLAAEYAIHTVNYAKVID